MLILYYYVLINYYVKNILLLNTIIKNQQNKKVFGTNLKSPFEFNYTKFHSHTTSSNNFIQKREVSKIHHGVSIQETRRFVYYSAAAYCKIKNIEPWGCKNCIGDTNTTRIISTISNQTLDTFAYIGINDYHREIIVAFRGTNGGANMIKNFKFWYECLFSNHNGIRVHAGFLEMAQSLYPQLEEDVIRLMDLYPNYDVKLTGHSMGGSLALINAVYLLNNEIVKPEYLQVVTYGQPRVGNTEFVEFVNNYIEKIARVTNKNDLVPLVPVNMFGYYHTKNEIHIDKYGHTKECSNSKVEDSKCASGAGFVKSLRAHFKYWDLKIFTTC